MDALGLVRELVSDYTLRTVALGSGALGVVSGALGSFAVLRRQSLLGDAMSHAALPGIALAFLLFRTKAPMVLMLGAALAGWVGTLVILAIVKTTRVKYDSALGLVLSVFFGFGLMLLTFIQRLPDATQAGLDKFLFGQAAALMERDVVIMAALGSAVLVTVLLLWKEFKLVSFDPEFGATLGVPVGVLDVVLTTLLVIAIAIGLQTVGVVLMSAMIVAPAAAARQWTNRLGVMVGLSALFGALAGIAGAAISSTTSHLPTGPMIVLCISAIVAVSLLFAPNRGLVWRWLARQRNRRRLHTDAVLENLLALARQHDDPAHGHEVGVLQSMSARQIGVERSLQELESRGLVRRVGAGRWGLTDAGLKEAEKILSGVESERS